MSSPAKTVLVRAVLPLADSEKTTLPFGTLAKTESKRIALVAPEMTTEMIARRIKDLSKSREEVLQTLRHLNVSRQAAPSDTEKLDSQIDIDAVKGELDEIRTKFEELQGKIETAQRKIDDCKKKVASLNEINESGFGSDQLESVSGEFRGIFGRLQTKKLDAARKTLTAQFKDQAIIAIGNKKQDTTFLLIATPRDKSSATSQTLLPFDFMPIDIPVIEHQESKSAIRQEEEQISNLTKDLDELKSQSDEFRKTAGQGLNSRLDNTVDTLMLLRGILKLGEGIQASQIYVRLEKTPPSETMSSLTKKGIIEIESSS